MSKGFPIKRTKTKWTFQFLWKYLRNIWGSIEDRFHNQFTSRNIYSVHFNSVCVKSPTQVKWDSAWKMIQFKVITLNKSEYSWSPPPQTKKARRPTDRSLFVLFATNAASIDQQRFPASEHLFIKRVDRRKTPEEQEEEKVSVVAV